MIMTAFGDLMLFARTAAQLRPVQVTQRARLRAQRLALRRVPATRRWLLAGPDPTTAVSWPTDFAPVDAALWRGWPGLPGLQVGLIELLGQARRLARPAAGTAACVSNGQADSGRTSSQWPDTDWATSDWAQSGSPLLWRFHLHYWDWAWALASGPDAAGPADCREWFAALWTSWQAATTPGRGDAWLSYPAAMRTWSWCGLYRSLVAGSEIEDAFLSSLAMHFGFLRRHLELDVGGNHLIKDLKALAGLAVFFADERMLSRALDRLSRQLAIQVLPDGGHFERAPAYHCQVLADLIDLTGLLQSSGHIPSSDLIETTLRMRQWLGDVLSPTGGVPLLNDGYPVNPALVHLLEPAATPAKPLLIFPDTGLARATAGSWHLLADVGAPCPDELPGHAHADTLSCLVYVDGTPIVVNTGTSLYTAGTARDYERSTAAHNTVEVDGVNSTEVWGTFRAGRRARVTDLVTRADGGSVMIEAAHDGFRRLPGRPRHWRRWSLSETGLHVEDAISGTGTHTVTVRWHLPPATDLEPDDAMATVHTKAGTFRVAMTGQPPITLSVGWAPIATGFGRTAAAPVLIGQVHARLPVRITTDWRRQGPGECEQLT